MPIDYSKYPPDWATISSRIRFERAQNRCENCGAENYKPHPITGSDVVLTVSHLNRDISDNRDENLKALCQFCHLKHDRGDNNKRKRYGKEYSKYPKINFDEHVQT
jgi:5-methylcytosine-specific restriction endonuclease McrA